jgi:hypothetical protein
MLQVALSAKTMSFSGEEVHKRKRGSTGAGAKVADCRKEIKNQELRGRCVAVGSQSAIGTTTQ